MPGDTRIMTLIDADAEFVVPTNRTILAKAYIKRIIHAVASYRLDPTPEMNQKNLVNAPWRSLLLIVVLVALHWLFKLTKRRQAGLNRRKPEPLLQNGNDPGRLVIQGHT